MNYVIRYYYLPVLLLLLGGGNTQLAGQPYTDEGPRMNEQRVDVENQQPPNIIVMYSDDHTAQSIGAYREALDYGLKLNHSPTPHIDRLAEGGLRFDNAFVTNSICKPSRAVLLTGQHSHKNGVLTNGESIDVDLETFPQLLQQADYQTAMIGKWHLGTEPQGFDYYEVLHGQGPYYNPTMRTPSGDIDREGHTSEVVTNSALRWLRDQRSREKPFMLVYNHKAPHRNWLPGPKHLHDYSDRDLPEPTTLFYDYSGLTKAAHEQDMEIATTMSWGWDLKVPRNPETGEPAPGWERLVKRNRLTDEQRKQIKKAYAEENNYLYEHYEEMTEKERLQWRYQRYVKDYLRVIRGLDDGVGRVMTYLERENLLDNTVVIYAGDQGFFMGENGWFDKRWIYEESMRMPLIVHWPEGIAPGMVNKELVQNLDLAPTILDLAGLATPDQMQGRSLMPFLKGESLSDWRDAVYYHYYEGPPRVHKVARHYGIRTNRYTLAHFYENDEWELFDLEEDPEQLRSVYDDADYAEVQEELKQKLRELQEKYEVENPER
ncbi:sulfatase family protein [Fodinibius sediminis]|uniref:Arylsulfatase A n=1 Tax=Fodinibius sediminis TaxID=1214077 RepID=A0A521DQ76_9BACT|nr:sulfatase [Fodinibius sediminis]SMO73715.1 Arylsulfatase A [Fodinibius sediminis]